MQDLRTVRAVMSFDQGLNPLEFSVFLRDDGDQVYAHTGHFGAFMDLGECVRELMHQLATGMVDAGWWA